MVPRDFSLNRLSFVLMFTQNIIFFATSFDLHGSVKLANPRGFGGWSWLNNAHEGDGGG